MTMTARVAPTVIDCAISSDLASLAMTTSGGGHFVVTAEKLRLSCRCAHCIRARFDDRFPARFPGIAIVEIGDLGYGLNIAFSDGHDRGIYPKSYLLDLTNT